MPSFCMVVNCGSKAGSKRDGHLSFFRLPSIYTNGHKICRLSQERRELWIKSLKRADLTATKIKYGRICSNHFHSGNPAKLHDRDHPDWVPTKNMGHISMQQSKDLNRYRRLQNRTERMYLLESNVDMRQEVPVILEATLSPTYEQLKRSLEKAKQEVEKLKKEISHFKLDEEILNNKKDILYFTGLQSRLILKKIYSEVEPYLQEKSTSVPKFQQLMLTLVRLRLNFDFTYLGKIFSCHRTTASIIFQNVIEILHSRFKNFVSWPT